MRLPRLSWMFLGAFGISATLPLLAAPDPTLKSTCAPTATTLCLNEGRFSVSATWQRSDGSNGRGNAVLLTDDTGYFWFFDPANIEVVTKALNACAVNDAYWVFSSGLTNVGVNLMVTDVATGRSRNYTSPIAVPYAPVQDTSSFATCSTPTTRVADVNGTWATNLTIGGFLYPASLTLVQVGTSVSGAASVFGGGGGSVTGTVDGQKLTFSVTEVSPCPGAYSGTALLSDSSLSISGSVSGSDCLGSYSGTVYGAKTFVGGPPSKGNALVAGFWDATLDFSQGQFLAEIAFVQNGSSINGTAVIAGRGSGSLTGSVVNDNIRFTVNELSPCLGIFVGDASVSGDAIRSGFISGSDCGGSYSGSFSATRR